MERFLGLLGAAGASLVLFAACGGKVVVDSTGATSGDSTTGGNGGAGGFSSASALDGPFSAAAVTSVVAVGVTSGGTTGSGMPCIQCAAAAMNPAVNTADICPDAVGLYKDLFACMCAGPCATQCSANVCIGQVMSGQCSACVANTGDGCGVQLGSCLSDM
ncbi:MAG: hypothetical protein ABJE95_17630 [Byssovorax sp.]